MIEHDKIICKDFESEVYTFISGELSENRKIFWEKHLLNCGTCISELEDVQNIVSTVKENEYQDVDNETFGKMIETAAKKKRTWLQSIFSNPFYDEKKIFYGKAALAGALVTVAIIISFVSRQPNPVKNIPAELLDWDGGKVTAQINELKNTINILSEDDWDKQIMLINQNMKKLEKQSDKFSFN